ncbi:MAG: hypothetical protein GY913_26470 [Proteobacteria bacterium]|nr:hypothetical protein [Pseudomonadota bacterium]MCP4920462.1 hypothetical protein [Pseudomonadota bacterium]
MSQALKKQDAELEDTLDLEMGFLDLDDPEIEMIEPLELVRSDEEEDQDDLDLLDMAPPPAVASIRARRSEVPVCEADPTRQMLRRQIPAGCFERDPECAGHVLDARAALVEWACLELEERDAEVLRQARKTLFAHVPQDEELQACWRKAVVMLSEQL